MDNNNHGILDGIKVLDFGRYIAGPFCGALLGDYGAEVIRIERVDGSEDRFVTPVTDNEEGGYVPSAKTGINLASLLILQKKKAER